MAEERGAEQPAQPAQARPTTSATIRGTDFVVDAAYTIQKFIGCGSFGVVCSALDALGQPCAIKKISNVFRNDTTAKRTLRELKLLLHFDHENVIGIHDLMCNSSDCSDLCAPDPTLQPPAGFAPPGRSQCRMPALPNIVRCSPKTLARCFHETVPHFGWAGCCNV